ncbi:XrtB/PEP-CTERM-associated polysaccharide biosynthesis outer membrane protein EpsL [Janthinobacterium sp.]|uniref:XrtB/PEP-CTERM-associated polysaccharide biosynthesis outer membrane protein EpsL n=1 Tax=Janthinobacterium sp. TaxID=1871054 RepID=UPI00293D844D|nr:XrtB/PEP-CTERM-associated polysaccharide biosynthesis outer membrane protein EpsL [Janthinobacterium sp.]
MLSFSPKKLHDRRPAAAKPVRAPFAGSATLAMLAGALCSAPAGAAISDTLHPFVAVTVSHDDNLFRLPDAVAGSDAPRGDTIRQVQGGLLFERPIGRQVLSGQAKLSKVTFANNDQLNYDGKDFLAALEWHVGNHVEGHVGSSYTQTLTPFTDSHSNERNLRVQRREYVDGAWRFHPSWRVRGAVNEDKAEYDLLSQRFNEHTEKGAELGVDYLASSDSRVGLQVRRVKGLFPNRRIIGATVIDEDYDQNELKANVYWRFSAVTQLQFVAGWVDRKHAFFTQRDSSGSNGRGTLYWTPTGKVRFTLSGWREYGFVESSTVSSSLNNGASLAADWDISAKVRANAQLKRETRDYIFFTNSASQDSSSDTGRTASLGLTYAPQSAIQLGVTLSHEVRNGGAAIGTGSYSTNGVSFNASAQF